MEKRKEEIMKFVFLLAACASIATVAMICLFLFANGLPTIGKIGAADFFLGERWRPANDVYGILPMILGSLYVTLGAIVVGVPVEFSRTHEAAKKKNGTALHNKTCLTFIIVSSFLFLK